MQTCAMVLSPQFYLRFLVAAIAPLRVVYVFPCQIASIFRAFLDMLTNLSNMAVQLDDLHRMCPDMGSVYIVLESSVTPNKLLGLPKTTQTYKPSEDDPI